MAIDKGIDQLGSFEKDLLLRWFFHKMPMDQRTELMSEFPLIYNKAVGHAVMEVINRAHEDLPVQCPICKTGAEGASTYRQAICDGCRETVSTKLDWACPTCQGPALADADNGTYQLCESCNAWYTLAGRLLSGDEVEKLHLNHDEDEEPLPVMRGDTPAPLPCDDDQNYGGL